MANPAKYVWLDDGLKDAAQSGIPIDNAGLHYGFSVFEGIRCYATSQGPAIFRLEEHVDRLLDSALIVGFRDLGWTRDSLIDAIHKTVSANKFSACYIRPVIYLDGAMDLVVDSGKPRLIIAVWEWTAFLGAEAKERGIRANIASFTRLHPNIMMTKAKVSGNYVSSILAKTESQRAGFDEAIMLDPPRLRRFSGARQYYLHSGPRSHSRRSRARACWHWLATWGTPWSKSRFRATSFTSPMKCSSAAPSPKWLACGRSTSAPSATVKPAQSHVPCKLNSTSSPAGAVRAQPDGCLRFPRSTRLWPERNGLRPSGRGHLGFFFELGTALKEWQMKKHKHHAETEAVRGGSDLHRKNGPLATPIYQTSTFEVTDNEQQVRATPTDMFYTRYGNPTNTVAEKVIAELEGADAAQLFSSGMNAITTSILALLKSGDHVDCAA